MTASRETRGRRQVRQSRVIHEKTRAQPLSSHFTEALNSTFVSVIFRVLVSSPKAYNSLGDYYK